MRSPTNILRISLPPVLVFGPSAALVVLTRPALRYDGIPQEVSAWGAFFMVLGVIYAIVAGYLLYWIIEDLDHPFFGMWNVDRAPLDELSERFQSEKSSPSAGS